MPYYTPALSRGRLFWGGSKLKRGLLLFFLGLSFLFSGVTAWAQSEAAAPGGPGGGGSGQNFTALSAEDLALVISALEDPHKRDELIKNLTALKEALAAAASGGEPAGDRADSSQAEEGDGQPDIYGILDPVDGLSDRILNDAKQLVRDIQGLSASAANLSDLLSQPENHQPVSRFLLRLGVVVLLFAALNQVIKAFKRHRDKRRPPVKSKVIKAFINILYEAMPYFIFLFILVPATYQAPPPGASPELVRVLGVLERFTLSFFYLAVLLYFCRNFASAVLAPERGASRLIPLSDQGAKVVHRFITALLNYTALYYFVVYGLAMNWPDSRTWAAAVKLMVLVFPVIITFYFLKLRRLWDQERSYGGRQAALPSRFFGKLSPYVKKYWLVPAVAYVWLMSILSFLGRQSSFSYFMKAILGTLLALGALAGLSRLTARFLGRLISDEYEAKAKIVANSSWLSKAVLAPLILLAILFFWEVPVGLILDNALVSLILRRLLAITAIGLIVFILLRASNIITSWLMSGSGRTRMWRTLTPIVSTAFRAGLIFIGLVSILERIGVNVGPILAGAGILGLGVGMGAQSLVKDIINGLTIIMSDTVVVGDVAMVGGLTGTVEAIGLRSVRLRDASGNLSIIPNSSIAAITNMTKHYSQELIDVSVSYRTDLNRAIEVLRRLGQEMYDDPRWNSDLYGPVDVLGVQSLDGSAVNIRVKLTCQPGKQWALSRALKLLIKNTFDQEGIEMPLPQLVIHQASEAGPPDYNRGLWPEQASFDFSGTAA